MPMCAGAFTPTGGSYATLQVCAATQVLCVHMYICDCTALRLVPFFFTLTADAGSFRDIFLHYTRAKQYMERKSHFLFFLLEYCEVFGQDGNVVGKRNGSVGIEPCSHLFSLERTL